MEAVTVVAIGTVASVLWCWSAGKGLIESFNFTILMWVWMAIALVMLRIAYLPMQYLRHKSALHRIERQERRLEQRAAAGDAGAAMLRHIRSGVDPRDVPWWRW